MTTDKTPPATCDGVQTTCDAPVLGEAEMKAINRCSEAYGMGAVSRTDWHRIVASHATLAARLRAAEERERTLTDALDRAGVDLMREATDFTLIGDKAQATWHRERGERLCKLAASPQRAGDGGTP